MQPEIDGEEPISPVIKALARDDIFGEHLEPYSQYRYSIMQRMGMLWPYPGEGAMAQMMATGHYPGLMDDMAIFFWVLRLKRPTEQTRLQVSAREWNTSRATILVREAKEAALEWASEFDILRPKTERFTKAFEIFMEMNTELHDAKFKIDAEKDQGDESPKV